MSLFQNDVEWLLVFITSAIEETILNAWPAGAIVGSMNRISKACSLGGSPLKDLLDEPTRSAGRQNRGEESKTMAPARSYLREDQSEIPSRGQEDSEYSQQYEKGHMMSEVGKSPT